MLLIESGVSVKWGEKKDYSSSEIVKFYIWEMSPIQDAGKPVVDTETSSPNANMLELCSQTRSAVQKKIHLYFYLNFTFQFHILLLRLFFLF